MAHEEERDVGELARERADLFEVLVRLGIEVHDDQLRRIPSRQQAVQLFHARKLGHRVDAELPEERRQLTAVGGIRIDDDTVELNVHVTHPLWG